MPIVDIRLNAELPVETTKRLLTEAIRAVAAAVSQPPCNVLAFCSGGPIMIDDSSAPAALVDVRMVTDLELEAKRSLCKRLCEALQRHGSLDPNRVFLQVSRVAPEDAWKGSPFLPTSARDRVAAEPFSNVAVREGALSGKIAAELFSNVAVREGALSGK